MGYRLVACVLSLSLSFAYGSESSVSYELPISDYTGGLEGLPLQERLWISGNWDCGRTQGQIRFEKNSSDSYQVTFSALEWPRTVCTAHVQISLLVEANRVLQTQFSLQSPTLEKLI